MMTYLVADAPVNKGGAASRDSLEYAKAFTGSNPALE